MYIVLLAQHVYKQKNGARGLSIFHYMYMYTCAYAYVLLRVGWQLGLNQSPASLTLCYSIQRCHLGWECLGVCALTFTVAHKHAQLQLEIYLLLGTSLCLTHTCTLMHKPKIVSWHQNHQIRHRKTSGRHKSVFVSLKRNFADSVFDISVDLTLAANSLLDYIGIKSPFGYAPMIINPRIQIQTHLPN